MRLTLRGPVIKHKKIKINFAVSLQPLAMSLDNKITVQSEGKTDKIDLILESWES